MQESDCTILEAVWKDVSAFEAVQKEGSVLETVLEGCVCIGGYLGEKSTVREGYTMEFNLRKAISQ